MTTAEFFSLHPVFSLDEAARALALSGGRAGAVVRLMHHVRKGRLKIVTRGVYAVVPPGVEESTIVTTRVEDGIMLRN